ncbi:MAG: NAD(P)H-dependent flavin oxidoreductase [Vulcanimicrobiaceae bacterium]
MYNRAMDSSTSLARLFDVPYPIVQAPMGGGATTPALVAAVSEAGGLGSLAAGYLAPEAIRNAVEKIRAKTARPFAINLFVGGFFDATQEQIASAQRTMAPYRRELGLPADAPAPAQFAEDLGGQLVAVREAKPAVFSFTFGIPEARVLDEFRRDGTVIVGTATNVAEAVALEAAGCDAICVQGSEAGAHRGTFIGDPTDSLVGTLALVPQVVDAVSLPVLASGGIMDGRGIAASFALGARGVQLGTAFLACPESGISAAYRAALLDRASDRRTSVTRTFSGRHARGIINRFMSEMHSHEDDLPPYPVQNALTRDIRAAAGTQGRAEFLSLWAGQGVAMIRELPAAEIVRVLVDETRDAFAGLSSAAQIFAATPNN